MKRNLIWMFCLFLIICSCKRSSQKMEDNPQKSTVNKVKNKKTRKIVKTSFGEILASAKVTGSILIYDEKDHIFYSNDFDRAKTGFIPASTFKIPNSLIALETGVIENDSTVIKWNGRRNRIEAWNQDLTFREAFHYSCVPCYQTIARRIGDEVMMDYIEDFNYGKMDINFMNIEEFWLVGDSNISQQEQIKFLIKFYYSQLPISQRTEKIAKRMMLVEQHKAYKVLAKTGQSTTNIGWYVGYLETKDKVYFFATNIKPKEAFDPKNRQQVTMAAFKDLGILD